MENATRSKYENGGELGREKSALYLLPLVAILAVGLFRLSLFDLFFYLEFVVAAVGWLGWKIQLAEPTEEQANLENGSSAALAKG